MKALTIFALFGTLLMFSACGGNGEEDEHMHEDGQEHMMEGDTMHEGEMEATVVYYCPMECEGDKTYAEPGTCPVCGMDLVVKETEGVHMHDGEEHMHEGEEHMHEGEPGSY